METKTTPAAPRPVGPRRVARPLWAAPLFAAGVALLVWVCVTRPFHNRPEQQPARDLAAARKLLDQRDGDAVEADSLVRHALEHAEHLPGRIGEATFLLGWAEARRAEKESPDQAGRSWADALRDLSDAEQLGVPDDDLQKLVYQLGKVGFFAKDDPRRVAERLARSAADADDRAEAYHLLTQAYFHLPQPDLAEALKANEQLRQVAVDDQLAEARLLGGELYMQLHRPDDAQKVLERISPPAPRVLVFKARCLRARGWQDEGQWAKAAALWQSLLADKAGPNDPAARPGVVLYHLGICYGQLEQFGEAAKVLEQGLTKAGDGDEGPACALALADLKMRDNDVGAALALFARAVGKTPAADAWSNGLVDGPKALEVFERAGAALRPAGQYEAALQLAAAYERLAGPAKANVYRGDVWTDWAQAGERQPQEPGVTTEAQPTAAAVRDRYREAGAAYSLAAAQTADAPTKVNYLWAATQRFLSGDDCNRAAASFAQLQQMDPRSPHLGEGWYQLGEAHRRASDADAAEAAYKESMKYPTVYAYRSRYQLAISWLEREDALVDDAEAALEQNLKLLRFDRDDEAQEKSLFAIGNLFFNRQKWDMAARRLEEALERFPDNAQAVRARYNLALSYQQMADQKNAESVMKSYKKSETVDHYMELNRHRLQRAAEEFEKLLPLLETPEGPAQPAPEELAKIRRQAAQIPADELFNVRLRAADCRFYAGQYAEALVLFDKLADRYAKAQRTPEDTRTYLYALGGTIRCHGPLIGPKNNHRDKLRQRMTELDMTLREVDGETRRQWQEWLAAVLSTLEEAAKKEK